VTLRASSTYWPSAMPVSPSARAAVPALSRQIGSAGAPAEPSLLCD
jgi:hypothetical protein